MSARRTEVIDLPVVTPGNRRQIVVYRYGQGRPKAYLHAGLHADEWPGLLVLQHLLIKLDQAAGAGAIRGEVVVVPVANPIGLGQFINGYLVGRYDFDATGNFNRALPVLDDRLIERLHDQLTGSTADNVDLIRTALRAAVAELAPQREAEVLKAALLAQSIDADYVFDLHCDHQAMVHIYAPQVQRGLAETLAAELDCAALLLEEEPGGGAFDQANSAPWRSLRERLGNPAVPLGCFACTVELRGQGDVDDALAGRDAAGLFRFLQRQGVIDGDPGVMAQRRGVTVPLEGVDVLRAPAAGLVVFKRELGDWLAAGEVVAELVDLDAIARRTPIHAGTSGLLFARLRDRLVRPGQSVCKIAGERPLDYRRAGALLQD